LDGEELVQLEILWDDLSGPEVKSCVHRQTIRILATQNPDDVKVNVDVIPGVTMQRTGMALEEARSEAEAGRADRALEILKTTVRQLQGLGDEGRTAGGIAALERMIQELDRFGGLSARSSKGYRYSSSHMRKMKSRALWTLDEVAPGYSEASLPPTPPSPPNAQPSTDPDAQA
jgi:hypothetical protein